MTNEKRLIDANALKQMFDEREADDVEWYGGVHIAECFPADDAKEIVDKMPTVDAVEVGHGKWLFDSGTERHFCSACNEYAISVITNEPVYEYDWEENLQFSHCESACDEQLTNYCPNCGAKMKGENEDG